MKRRTLKSSKAFHKAALMPALKHWDRSGPFDISKSEAVRWLLSQPEIQAYVFSKMRGSKAIAFDPASGTWRGTAK